MNIAVFNLKLTSKSNLTISTVFWMLTLLVNSAQAQDLNLVFPNQSSQFFNQKNRQLEKQINILNSDLEPVKIKLPENYNLPQNFDQTIPSPKSQTLETAPNSITSNLESQ